MTRLPESTARRYGQVFDEIAAEYDRRRPAYPDQLVDQACRVAGIGSGDHVLELGCGSGQLTRGLAARGLHVMALEPGPSLIALAGQNLEGTAELEFVNAQFEGALLPREQFQAVFSASAFHWVDPKVSWQKSADVLVCHHPDCVENRLLRPDPMDRATFAFQQMFDQSHNASFAPQCGLSTTAF